MTAGKNQPQTIVFKAVLFSGIGPFPRTRLRFEIVHQLVLRRIKSCPSTQSINGFESGRRNQPGSRVAGHSTPRPQAQRSRKGFVHRLLGQIEIAQQADQSCQDSSRLHAIKGVEQFAYLLAGILGYDRLGHDALGCNDDLSKPATPNQFGKWWMDANQASGTRSIYEMGCRRVNRPVALETGPAESPGQLLDRSHRIV